MRLLSSRGQADLHEAEATVRLVSGLARAARRDIPVRVLLNRVRRTQLARHAAREAAELPLLTATLSDLVAYGEISFSGQIPRQGAARCAGAAAGTIATLEAEAKQQGISMKLVITKALAAAGVKVADADLIDGTPRRRTA